MNKDPILHIKTYYVVRRERKARGGSTSFFDRKFPSLEEAQIWKGIFDRENDLTHSASIWRVEMERIQ